MIKQSIPAQRHCGVADNTNAVVKVFKSAEKRDRLIHDFNETKKLLHQGLDPRLAFPPSTDVAALIALTKRTSYLKPVELKHDIDVGSIITQEDVSPAHWRQRPSQAIPSSFVRSNKL